MSEVRCPPGSHFVIIDEATWVCMPDAHEVPVADTLSLTGLALAILCVALWRRI